MWASVVCFLAAGRWNLWTMIRCSSDVMISHSSQQQMSVPINLCLGELWKIRRFLLVLNAQNGEWSNPWLFIVIPFPHSLRFAPVRIFGAKLANRCTQFSHLLPGSRLLRYLHRLGELWFPLVTLVDVWRVSVSGNKNPAMDTSTCYDLLHLDGSTQFGSVRRPSTGQRTVRTANVAISTLPVWAVPGSLSDERPLSSLDSDFKSPSLSIYYITIYIIIYIHIYIYCIYYTHTHIVLRYVLCWLHRIAILLF